MAEPLDVLGAYDPCTAGLNSSAIALDGFAYLGSWGSAAECPGLGARILDVHNPTAPEPIASAAVYSGTTAQHLAAVHVATDAFKGRVPFAGISRCCARGGRPSALPLWH